MQSSITALNDYFRSTFCGGKVLMTRGVATLDETARNQVIDAVRGFDAFDPGNDPYGEHDFGTVQVEGKQFFFKIDYYNRDMSAGSDDPADMLATIRVLTIMRADEY